MKDVPGYACVNKDAVLRAAEQLLSNEHEAQQSVFCNMRAQLIGSLEGHFISICWAYC